jgi:hypothetical protein
MLLCRLLSLQRCGTCLLAGYGAPAAVGGLHVCGANDGWVLCVCYCLTFRVWAVGFDSRFKV